jgi:orotate phosphoribosyltransferase
MTADDVLEIFRQAGAILEGHFILSSGLRSPIFLQKALVFRRPDLTELLCRALAAKVREAGFAEVDLVVSPAVGGIIPGYETARQLGLAAIWVEREDGRFRLRRGFAIPPGSRVLLVEDIITTGLSSREAIACTEAAGGRVVACACLIDRSAGEAELGVPLVALAEYKVPAFRPEDLPPELAAIPAVKPGSRGLA